MSTPGGELETRVEIREGYVFVWQKGVVRTEAELESFQREIAAALSEADTRIAMFDNRETDRPNEWIRASMWTWISANIDRAALLQAVPRNIKRAERRGADNRIVVRAFDNEAEAQAWLLGQ